MDKLGEETERELIQQAYDIMSSYSGGPCEDQCGHDDCTEYTIVESKLEEYLKSH